MSGLRRFLHLERPRTEPVAPDSAPVDRRRFGAVDATPNELAEAQAHPAPPSDAADRFSEPPLRAPDVASPAPDAQPFQRCCRCGTDNTVYVRTCAHCGAELDTAEQRTFNERLWATRRAEAQQLDDEVRTLRESAARAEEEAYRARREMGELIAREVGRQERERLDRDDARWGQRGPRWGSDDAWGPGGAPRDPRPLGIRLLFSIQDPGRRLLAIAAVVSVFVFLVAAAFMSPALGQLLWIAVFLLAVFFAPRNRWRRW